jgi:hypothetical protein
VAGYIGETEGFSAQFTPHSLLPPIQPILPIQQIQPIHYPQLTQIKKSPCRRRWIIRLASAAVSFVSICPLVAATTREIPKCRTTPNTSLIVSLAHVLSLMF